MPYRKTATAPVVFNLGTSFATKIVGTDKAWLGDYIPYIGFDVRDTEATCEAGPPTYEPWSMGDFFPNVFGFAATVAKVKNNALSEVYWDF